MKHRWFKTNMDARWSYWWPRGDSNARQTVLGNRCSIHLSYGATRGGNGRRVAFRRLARAAEGRTIVYLLHLRGWFLVEIEGCREVPVRLDLRFQFSDSLLRGGNGVGACDKAARRWLLARDRDERLREFLGVTGLPAVLRFPEFKQRRSALGSTSELDHHLDRLAIVHCSIAVGHSVEVGRSIEDAAGVDAAFEDVGK
jgi:hypothetical protein